MPRTQQSSRKSTGGIAPRASFAVNAPISTGAIELARDDGSIGSAGSANGDASEANEGHEDYCYICINGGTLFLCAKCTRVVCDDHFTLPLNADISRADFICIACHMDAFKDPEPYMGFYRPSSLRRNPQAWQPVLPKPLELTVEYQMTSKSRVVNQPLLLLHFALEGINLAGFPPRLVHSFLSGFLSPSHLRFEEIIISLGTEAEVEVFRKRMQTLVSTFHSQAFQRVVVFITTHSHEDTGDLFIAKDLCAPVQFFMDSLFPPVLSTFLGSAELTVFMLSCGSLIGLPDSFEALARFIKRMKVDDLVAFSATKLQPSLTSTFFMDYAQRVLVEGYPLQGHFKSILAASAQSNVARHTNLVYFQRQKLAKLDVSEFIFTHSVVRPWGHRVPSTCSCCKSPRPWSKPVKQGQTIIFVCTREGCRGTRRFTKPDNVEMLGTTVNGGQWMVKKRSV